MSKPTALAVKGRRFRVIIRTRVKYEQYLEHAQLNQHKLTPEMSQIAKL